MRKLIIAAATAAALASASVANAAIVVGGGGTTGSSTGSSIVVGNLDNGSIPESFTFDTFVTDNGANSPYTSFFDFSNDLAGVYNFSVTTAVLGGTITLEQVLNNGTLSLVTSASGSSNSLSLLTPILTAGTSYRFSYTAALPSNGKISGNAAFYPVPEPSTWAMMLVGFAGIGMAMRRRRRPGLAQIA